MPVVGTVHVGLAQQCPVKIAEVVEAEQGTITGAVKVPFVPRAFLRTVRLTDRTIQVQNQYANRFALPNAINPSARLIHKGIKMISINKLFERGLQS